MAQQGITSPKDSVQQIVDAIAQMKSDIINALNSIS